MIGSTEFLWQCVEYWASVKGDEEALVFEDARLSWSELAEQVDQAARAFLALGVERGDCIACVATARPEFLISFLAASKISALWTGISPRYTVGEMGHILRGCRPRLLITQERYHQTNLLERAFTFNFELSSIEYIVLLDGHHDDTPSFHNLLKQDYSNTASLYEERLATAQTDESVLLMYTSGSSGEPKGVLHSHNSVISNVSQQHRLYGIHHDSRILLHFPINHVAADVEIGYCALYAGATIVLQPEFDAKASLEAIEKKKITVLGQVPAMFMLQLREESFHSICWDSVRTFVWGGSPASREMLEALDQICSRTGAELVTGYGSTELCGFITSIKKKAPFRLADQSTGPAYSTCEIRVVNEQRISMAANHVGEIAVRGPVVMKGYLNDPEQTAEVLDEEGWYYTQDLGTLDEEGNLTLHGRRTDMFKTGGENVFPSEIEMTLESHPEILFAAIIAIPDEVFNEVSHAHVMAVPGSDVSEKNLLQWCRDHLAHFKIPHRVHFYPALPLLPNGKVDKIKLLELTPL
ncbi:MAG: AMP-binding protein [Candidatus Hydrogenedens sp.]|jgi:acyl-CoA synthetase (AMP-forming)/AMP-acid ligase II|nr:AMP-binding protein [Candidatus Hydrogenedens sp.]